jgi:hypothetical protein
MFKLIFLAILIFPAIVFSAQDGYKGIKWGSSAATVDSTLNPNVHDCTSDQEESPFENMSKRELGSYLFGLPKEREFTRKQYQEEYLPKHFKRCQIGSQENVDNIIYFSDSLFAYWFELGTNSYNSILGKLLSKYGKAVISSTTECDRSQENTEEYSHFFKMYSWVSGNTRVILINENSASFGNCGAWVLYCSNSLLMSIRRQIKQNLLSERMENSKNINKQMKQDLHKIE